MRFSSELKRDAVELEEDVLTVNKVAEVTFAFWVMKICATTVGETGGDLLSMTLNVGYSASSIILIGIFLISLLAQLKSKTFRPFLYWTVIWATSTAGTTMSDFMDRTLSLGYATGSTILVGILICALLAWRFSVGTLSVAHIGEPKVEVFYWTAILASNTLGTALGDFMSDSSGLGYVGSNLIISGTIGLIALAYYFTPISRTALFWAAFVLTRPFGATMGDLLTKPPSHGGLGFGTAGATAILISVLVGSILLSSRSEPARQTVAVRQGRQIVRD